VSGTKGSGARQPGRLAPWAWVLAAGLLGAVTLFGLWKATDGERSPVSESTSASVSDSSERPSGSEKLDTVLIADFANRTGNPELDGVLESALARELSSSTFLAVATRGRVRDTLRLMRLPEDSPIDAETAREIARRDGSIRAVVSGSIEGAGAEAILTATLVAPADGTILESFSTVAGEEDATISAALQQLSRELRTYLGENIERIDPGEPDRQKVTTRSFRSLRLYEEAEAVIARSGQDATSEELLREAIRGDPEFASAHLLLGYAVFNQTRDRSQALPHIERAMQLADDVPDRERYFIRATHFFFRGDVDKAIANYSALLRLHPDHFWGNNNLATLVGPTPGIPYHVNKATDRPNDLDANWDAAHALAIVGNRPTEAQPFIDRVVELAEIEIPRWQNYEAAWARLWKSHQHWLIGDLEGARTELDLWVAELDGMSGGELALMRKVLARSYRSLGLVTQAQALLPLPDYRLRRRFFVGLDAFLAQSTEDAAQRLGGDGWSDRGWGDVLLQDPLRVAGLARAGDFAEGERALEAYEQHSRAPTPDMAAPEHTQKLLMQTLLALAHEDLTEAEELLETVLNRDWEHYGATFFLAIMALADIHQQTGRDEEGVALLERAVAQRERSYPFGMEMWMNAQLELAGAHRRLGYHEAAETLEDELRALTAVADPDFWLVRRLESRTSD